MQTEIYSNRRNSFVDILDCKYQSFVGLPDPLLQN